MGQRVGAVGGSGPEEEGSGGRRVSDTARQPSAEGMGLSTGHLRLSVLTVALPNFTESVGQWASDLQLRSPYPQASWWLFQSPFSTTEAHPQLLQECGRQGPFLVS